jgi:hypothetical protein
VATSQCLKWASWLTVPQIFSNCRSHVVEVSRTTSYTSSANKSTCQMLLQCHGVRSSCVSVKDTLLKPNSGPKKLHVTFITKLHLIQTKVQAKTARKMVKLCTK